MTTETKKYRRRVSDERVHKILDIFSLHYTSLFCLGYHEIKAVLEADAEVIEGCFIVSPDFGGEDPFACFGSIGRLVAGSCTRTIAYCPEGELNCRVYDYEQFHAEWEEIPND